MKIIVILITCSTLAFSQSAGNSGLSFLKFGFGARNIAMADAGTAASNDLTALHYNPAKLTMNDKSEIIIMHNQWIQAVRSEMLGVKSFVFGIPFALGFNVTNVSDIEIRTKAGEPESTFDANYFFSSISTAFNLSNENLSASAVVKNLGSMNKLKNEKTKLPSEFRIGGAYDFDLGENKFDVISVLELQKYLETDDIHFNIGGEVFYDKLIALRFGYQTGYESRGFTGGLGLHWGNLGFDYAFLPFSLGLGNASLFSLQFKF